MNTREIAEEYRLSHWAGILRERKDSGLSIRAYCKQAGIHENVFYYWQRRLREAALEDLTVQPTAPEGWALCATKAAVPSPAVNAGAASAEQLKVEIHGVRITVSSAYPVAQLARLLRELMSGC